MSEIVDQPPPVASNNHRPAWDLVVEYVERVKGLSAQGMPGIPSVGELNVLITDMRERDRLGHERYGVRLSADNGRKHLVDAYQEQLDYIVYLRAWLDEHAVDFETMHITPAPETDEQAIAVLFFAAIGNALVLRDLISRGL